MERPKELLKMISKKCWWHFWMLLTDVDNGIYELSSQISTLTPTTKNSSKFFLWTCLTLTHCSFKIESAMTFFSWYFPYATFSMLRYNVCCYQNSLLIVNHFNVISVSQDSKADPGQQTIKIWKYESTV